jgi:hypothetical protein
MSKKVSEGGAACQVEFCRTGADGCDILRISPDSLDKTRRSVDFLAMNQEIIKLADARQSERIINTKVLETGFMGERCIRLPKFPACGPTRRSQFRFKNKVQPERAPRSNLLLTSDRFSC